MRRIYTPEDTFFATILGAWASTRTDLWVKQTGYMIATLMGILCLGIAISAIRQYKDDENIAGDVSLLGVISGFVVFFIAAMCCFTPNFLSISDKLVLGICTIIWLAMLIAEKADERYKMKLLRRNKGSVKENI